MIRKYVPPHKRDPERISLAMSIVIEVFYRSIDKTPRIRQRIKELQEMHKFCEDRFKRCRFMINYATVELTLNYTCDIIAMEALYNKYRSNAKYWYEKREEYARQIEERETQLRI